MPALREDDGGGRLTAGPRKTCPPANKSPDRGDPIVKITYRDHVAFRRVDAEHLEVVRREAIGWIVDQDEERIILVQDRVVSEDALALLERGVVDAEARPIERGLLGSGLVLLRALVEEVVELG